VPPRSVDVGFCDCDGGGDGNVRYGELRKRLEGVAIMACRDRWVMLR